MIKSVEKIYKKLCQRLSVKKMMWITMLIFILMLLPVFYCSFVNRASGDDYGYAVLTRNAWISTHSLLAVIKAACQTVKHYYYGWQGTWFDIFLFSLQPEVFHVKAYVIVAFFMLFIWISSTYLLFGKLLVDKLKLEKQSANLLILVFLIINISYIPGTKSSIFWYNGCAHYMVPFTMCQLLLYCILKYEESYKKRYFVLVFFLMTLLGGANYQAALFALIVTVYFMLANFLLFKNKKILSLIFPLVSEMTGLFISMKAPGNYVRAGEDFGFSISLIFKTVLLSFAGGIKDGIGYVQRHPLIIVGFFVLFLIMLEVLNVAEIPKIKNIPVMVLSVFCLYSAMQAPAIYANVEVSQGVGNTNFQTFTIMIFCILTLVAYQISFWMKENKEVLWKEKHKKIFIPGLFLCMILVIVFRSDIKETTTFKCMDYIVTGEAADYKVQMEQLTELMMDDSTMNVIVPFINDIQGPLMHMPVTENEDAWTNTVICQYYGKNSVVAIPRLEWEEKYGK